MKIAEQDGSFRAGDDQDDEDEKQESEHVVHLMRPEFTNRCMSHGARYKSNSLYFSYHTFSTSVVTEHLNKKTRKHLIVVQFQMVDSTVVQSSKCSSENTHILRQHKHIIFSSESSTEQSAKRKGEQVVRLHNFLIKRPRRRKKINLFPGYFYCTHELYTERKIVTNIIIL